MFLANLGSLLPDSPDAIFAHIHQVKDWEGHLGKTALASWVNTYFAYIEIVHFLGLFIFSASVILTSLRLIGVGLVEETSAVIEKNTRWFLHIGFVLAIGSGLLMGVGNADKLYNSEIFTVKMIAMFAGLFFTYFVMVPVAQNNGQATPSARIWMVIALAMWLLALVTFSIRPTANVGMFHIMWAGALILFIALQGKLRMTYGVGLLLIIIAWQIITHIFIREDLDAAKYMVVNKAFMYLSGFWIFGLSLLNVFGKGAVATSNSFARMTAYATILVWVSVGAGGRWIGLS